jgi:hypothetical protein
MMNEREKTMNTYLVYQLPFDHDKKRDMSFLTVAEFEEISDEYELVARIDARTADEAFRIGNFVCEEDASLIEVVGEMHSISVGDILVDLSTDTAMVVGSIGFSKINMKEAE